MIAPFPLLFFGGEISVFVEEGYETVAVDDFIKFKSPTRIANLVKVGIICWISLFLSGNADVRLYRGLPDMVEPTKVPGWIALGIIKTRKLHRYGKMNC